MKLGVVSAILGSMDFFEMVDCVSSLGYACVEAACWPGGKADRRYAGVNHIDVRTLDKAAAKRITSYCTDRNVAISALAFYPNTMGDRPELVKQHIEHLKCMIDAAVLLEVDTVTTFIGRDPRKTVEESLDTFSAVWPPLVEYAGTRGIRIAIENCPMLFSQDEWPGGKNLAFSPAVWRKLFERLPAENFGLNYDPSHFIWQHIDYISPLYEFREKIFHVHFKDIRLDHSKLRDVGTLAYPLEYMRPVLPGLGDVDWAGYVAALRDIGYTGYSCVEIEDKSFEDSQKDIMSALVLSKRYLEQFII